MQLFLFTWSLGKDPDKPHFNPIKLDYRLFFYIHIQRLICHHKHVGVDIIVCVVKTRRMVAFPNKLRMWTLFSLVQSMKHSLDWLVNRMIGYLFPLLESPLMPIVMFMQGQFNVCKLCIWTNAFPNVSQYPSSLNWQHLSLYFPHKTELSISQKMQFLFFIRIMQAWLLFFSRKDKQLLNSVFYQWNYNC